jgi:hypothetical protein
VPPTTVEGIERYLSSGLVKDIGPVLAKKLVVKAAERMRLASRNDLFLTLDQESPAQQAQQQIVGTLFHGSVRERYHWPL